MKGFKIKRLATKQKRYEYFRIENDVYECHGRIGNWHLIRYVRPLFGHTKEYESKLFYTAMKELPKFGYEKEP